MLFLKPCPKSFDKTLAKSKFCSIAGISCCLIFEIYKWKCENNKFLSVKYIAIRSSDKIRSKCIFVFLFGKPFRTEKQVKKSLPNFIPYRILADVWFLKLTSENVNETNSNLLTLKDAGGWIQPIRWEIACHFSQDQTMVTKILDFMPKHPN